MTAPLIIPDHLGTALAYARRGWRVIPIPMGQKHPAIPAWQTAGTTDTGRITHWWTTAPTDGIGIVTGAESGLFVVDIDVADGKHGDDTLAELEATHGALPATIEVITGSGGRHLYFAWPIDGTVIRNSASGALGPGIDVRGEGGQVLAPPTIHPNGTRYEAEASSAHELAEAPAWLLDLLTAGGKPAEEYYSSKAPAPTGDRPGDLFAAAVGWAELLERDGWTLHHTDRDGEQHWTRPGKDRREGTSATVGYKGADVLKVFSSSVPWLDAEQTYSKLGYIAARDHGGDHSAAASALADQGYRAPTSRLKDLIAKLPDGDIDWPDPEPLITTPAVPDFPLDALPAWCVEHVQAVARAVQVPVDAPATFAIGALSAVATGRAQVHVDDTHAEPVNLYLALIMRSGTGKSPVEKLTATWARRWVSAKVAEAKPAHDKAMMKARAARKRADAAEQSHELGRIDSDEAFAAHVEALAAEEGVPPLPYLFIDDATPEAVIGNLKAYSERQAVISTEADLFDMVTSDARRRPNINVYLRAWSGDTLTKNRKGGDAGPEAVELQHPLMSVCCAVQPVVLDRVAADPELVKRGFVPRFMVTVPADFIGQRDHALGRRAGRITTQADYDRHATACAERWSHFDRSASIELSDAAWETYVGWLNAIEPDLAPGADLEYLGEWFAKLKGSVARYAGLLWLAEGNDAEHDIDDATMRRAVELGDYWLAHAYRAYAPAADIEAGQALAILDTITEKGWRSFTASDLQKACRRPAVGLVKVADYVPALGRLVDNGWVRTLDGTPWAAGVGTGRKSPDFIVWPKLHETDWRSHVSRGSRVARRRRPFSTSLSLQPSPSTPRDARTARQSESSPSVPSPVDNATSTLGVPDPTFGGLIPADDDDPTPGGAA